MIAADPSPDGRTRDMILRTSMTSPFGRKVRMAIIVLGLEGRVELRHADTLDKTDPLRDDNPLGKIPCLVLADGRSLFDSRTIVEYLATLSPAVSFYPPDPLALALERTRVVLADGITDAALLMVYEGRFRETNQRSSRWLDHQGGKLQRALSAIERDLPPPDGSPSPSAFALACALGYLDWRRPVEWRASHPRLESWLNAFDSAHPRLAQTYSIA